MSLRSLLRTVLLACVQAALAADVPNPLPRLCYYDEPLVVRCTCQGDQDLVLSEMGRWLQSEVSSLKITDCRQASVDVLGHGSPLNSSLLQLIVFSDIKTLSLYKNSLDLILTHSGVFKMRFSRVQQLMLTRGSVRLSGAPASLVLSDVGLSAIPAFAIEATSLRLLRLSGVTLLGEAQSAAIIVGGAGALIEFLQLDARGKLQEGWLAGEVLGIRVHSCRLALMPGAFKRVSLANQDILKTVSLHNNIFLPVDSRENSVVVPSELFSLGMGRDVLTSVSGNAMQCLHQLPSEQPRNAVSCAFYNSSLCVEPHLTIPVDYGCKSSDARQSVATSGKPTVQQDKDSVIISL